MTLYIGFTGTRRGMTPPQKTALRQLLAKARGDATEPLWFLHGGAVGADAEAHSAAHDLGFLIEVFPSDRQVAELEGQPSIIHQPLHPLDRNRKIVDSCAILLACPAGPEQPRGGTWSTIRYARRRGRHYHIIWPDGSIS